MPQQLCGHSSSHAHIVHMITYTTANSEAPNSGTGATGGKPWQY
jgi:hypothetical protein